MIIYSYKCPKCDNYFEKRKSVDEMHEAECPKCDTVSPKLFTPPTAVINRSVHKCGTTMRGSNNV